MVKPTHAVERLVLADGLTFFPEKEAFQQNLGCIRHLSQVQAKPEIITQSPIYIPSKTAHKCSVLLINPFHQPQRTPPSRLIPANPTHHWPRHTLKRRSCHPNPTVPAQQGRCHQGNNSDTEDAHGTQDPTSPVKTENAHENDTKYSIVCTTLTFPM